MLFKKKNWINNYYIFKLNSYKYFSKIIIVVKIEQKREKNIISLLLVFFKQNQIKYIKYN